MKGSGGTEGGISTFVVGFALSALSCWLFFDSVRITTGQQGFVSGYISQQFRGGSFETGSMGLVFIPFFLGVIALFYDAKPKWSWILMYSGLGIIAIEILSRIRFLMNIKSSHLLLLLGMFAAGVGLMLKSYKDDSIKE
jgi:hypothetical protein